MIFYTYLVINVLFTEVLISKFWPIYLNLTIFIFFSDKIATGSFDKMCKLWDANSGSLIHTYRGHSAEIVCLSFNPQSTIVATGSMDSTAKLWDVNKGIELSTLKVNQVFIYYNFL